MKIFLRSRAAAALFFLGILSAVGCAGLRRSRSDPFFESFFEKTRLIMTAEEIRNYKFLEDPASKEEFIREFWKIRDPDPTTEENEAQTEFENRVAYACRWFSPNNVRSYREDYQPIKSERGWDTDMGRIYIVLGPPDMILFAERGVEYGGDIDRRLLSGYDAYERWYYERYYLWISFQRTSLAGLSLANAALAEAMETARLNWINPGLQADIERIIKFKGSYESDNIVIVIPTNRINFKEENGKLTGKCKIQITVYRDHKKLERLEEEKNLEETEESLLRKDGLRLEIPYTLREKGAYLLDILLEDKMSLTYSRARRLIKVVR